MRCYLPTKWRLHHRVLLMKPFENHFVFPNVGEEKQKKCIGLLLKRKDVLYLDYFQLGLEKLDLAIVSVSLLFTQRNTLIVFLGCLTNNRCLNILGWQSN